jgi:hypothetical protein
LSLDQKSALMAVMLYKSFHKLNSINYKDLNISNNSDLILNEYYDYYTKFIIFYENNNIEEKNKVKRELYKLCVILVLNKTIIENKIFTKNKTTMY